MDVVESGESSISKEAVQQYHRDYLEESCRVDACKTGWQQVFGTADALTSIPSPAGLLKVGAKFGIEQGIKTVGKQAAKKAGGKAVNLPAWRRIEIDMEHIGSGHMAGGSRVSPDKDLFPSSMDGGQVSQAVRQAYRNARRVETNGERVRVRGLAGDLEIDMWVNTKTRTIETAYPYIKRPAR